MAVLLYIILLAVVLFIGLFCFRLWRVIDKSHLKRLETDAKEARDTGHKLVVCFGDSLTQGGMSFDWVSRLAKAKQPEGCTVLNAGVNGELAYNLAQRVDQIVQLKPDLITLLVGTNDVRAIENADAGKVYQKQKQLPQLPDEAFFKANYSSLLSTLRDRIDVNVVVIGIPLLGESSDDPNRELIGRINSFIREQALTLDMEYVDLEANLREVLSTQEPAPQAMYSANTSLKLMGKSVFLRCLLGWSWDRIARANGCSVTTDMIHLSDKGGKVLLEQIKTRC